MITQTQFDKRVKVLYQSQKKMAAPKKWKSGKREGTIRRPGMPVEFSEAQLRAVLMARVGFNVILCPFPFCNAPIDILSLTLDHVVPRALGGGFTLSNMQICCVDCNARKGEISDRGFRLLMTMAQKALDPYDYQTLLSRLKAASAGSRQRFFRGKKDGEQNALPPAAQQYVLEEEF
jgi:5-methylcytosine-specific restriction endonuclease McrA